jgi:hypothetical protein
MTIERKFIAGLEDIKAVSLECITCHYRVTFPPDDIRNLPGACAHCGQHWITFDPAVYDRGSIAIATSPVVNFTNSIRTLRTLIQNSGMGFRFQLEFADPRARED